MQFLAPLFLAAALAVAIPIVLHLIQREKREAEPFPSLMFLRRIPHRSTRRRRIRDLPLLLLRVLALLLLAAAFARPLFERDGAPRAAAGSARDVVLLLDRSYSMAAAGRWEAARRAALAEVDALGPADRMTVVAFDAGAAALNQPSSDRRQLRSLVEAVTPGWGGTRFDPALRLAANLVAASTFPRREVVVISDLQRAGAGDGIEVKLPAGTAVRALAIPAAAAANLAVAGVTFRREEFQRQERITATARIVNTTDSAVTAAPVTLELDGRPLPAQRVNVPAHGSAAVTLPTFTLSAPVRGSVRLASDALPVDDVRHFSLAPDQAIDVLALEARGAASLFLARALSVGGAPGFTVATRSGSAVGAAELRGRDVVVLNDVPAPAGEAFRRLREFVEQGGGLIVALGPSSGSSAELAALLPGRAGQMVDRTQGGGARLGYLDLEHPVLELFRAPRSGDLTAVRFYRYRPVQLPAAPDSTTAVLARFDDGSVALAERRVGRGRVLLWGSTLDREWNDAAVLPVFVPFTHQLVKHAAGFEEPRAARTVGEVVDARAAARAAEAAALVVVAPDGSRRPLAPGARALPLERSGFYSVRRASDDAALATVAANVDVGESDFAALDPIEFAAAVRTPGESVPTAAATTLTLAERERRQALWWYLLAAAVVLLAVETLLSNRSSRRLVRAREG